MQVREWRAVGQLVGHGIFQPQMEHHSHDTLRSFAAVIRRTPFGGPLRNALAGDRERLKSYGSLRSADYG